MNEYRRDVQKHKPDSEYARVELGPIPRLPAWHIQSKPTSYQFPTNAAALKFAATYRVEGREVTVYMKEVGKVLLWSVPLNAKSARGAMK